MEFKIDTITIRFDENPSGAPPPGLFGGQSKSYLLSIFQDKFLLVEKDIFDDAKISMLNSIFQAQVDANQKLLNLKNYSANLLKENLLFIAFYEILNQINAEESGLSQGIPEAVVPGGWGQEMQVFNLGDSPFLSSIQPDYFGDGPESNDPPTPKATSAPSQVKQDDSLQINYTGEHLKIIFKKNDLGVWQLTINDWFADVSFIKDITVRQIIQEIINEFHTAIDYKDKIVTLRQILIKHYGLEDEIIEPICEAKTDITDFHQVQRMVSKPTTRRQSIMTRPATPRQTPTDMPLPSPPSTPLPPSSPSTPLPSASSSMPSAPLSLSSPRPQTPKQQTQQVQQNSFLMQSKDDSVCLSFDILDEFTGSFRQLYFDGREEEFTLVVGQEKIRKISAAFQNGYSIDAILNLVNEKKPSKVVPQAPKRSFRSIAFFDPLANPPSSSGSYAWGADLDGQGELDDVPLGPS